ncbi:MAG: LysM peptidoglycan-binding domain-containing protein [Sphingosinicella sp.]|uniref:LysM peptidoglycan-binding domain-containing protein n=1 Tax=Sphingosinicella sp. TaxID=1917971 RepID=UPI004037FACB
MSNTYTVKSGDTLGKIAAKLGTTVAALAQANAIQDVNRIRPGQVLKIPGAPAAAPPPPTPSPPPPRPAPAPAPAPRNPYAPENLALGVNAIFQTAILEAAQRTGMPPQTVAAIINAEAAKKRNGEWNPDSKAGTSSASGLTQFLDATWLGEAKRGGGLLNAEAKALGLVSAANAVVRSAELLGKRFDPRLSILAGADFARNNLAAMRAVGLIGGTVDPAGLAKLAYVAHHEGPSRAIRVLKGDMGYVTDALFRANVVDAARRQTFINRAGGNKGLGYRIWLTEYTDTNIDVCKFMADKTGVNVPSVATFYR